MAKKVSDFRFERKFRLRISDFANIEQRIKLHPLFFKPIYHQRRINNIYFDSHEHHYLHANVAGVSNREKCRIRWYNELYQSNSDLQLEYKIKDGLLGKKETYTLSADINEHIITETQLFELLLRFDTDESRHFQNKLLKPQIINQYDRKYFESACRRFRFTIDTNLKFYSITTPLEPFYEEKEHIILELKYAKDHDFDALKLMQSFPFRLTKSSKYVDGMLLKPDR